MMLTIAALLIAAVVVWILIQDFIERRQLRRALDRPARRTPSARQRFHEAQRNWEQNPTDATYAALSAAEQSYILEQYK